MKCYCLLGIAVGLWATVSMTWAQQYAPPAAKPPDPAVVKTITAKIEKLEQALALLRSQGVQDLYLVNLEVYHKAAVWIVRHGEWYQPAYADWTLEALDRGLLRANQVFAGELPWLNTTALEFVRGYRSQVDGSVQPYAVTLPAEYGKQPNKKWRIDVVLHGRDASLNEVKFLHQHGQGKAAAKDQDFIRIDIFGRVNNAYRWAGETDVFEAVNNFIAIENKMGRARLVDAQRRVLRGFSMGGAGTWHMGLHYPDRWCVIGPGAGFTTTHGYIKGLPAQLPPYQESCLRIYDAADYAENAFNVPVVAYSGADDAQKAAADNIEARLKATGIKMTHLVAPGLGHSFPAEWQQKAETEYARYAGPGKGRQDYPLKVRFVTYTLRYPSCAWVEVVALDRHYVKTLVEAEKTEDGFTVKTTNVRALRLTLPDIITLPHAVKIDGQELNVRPTSIDNGVHIYLERVEGRWQSVLPQFLFVSGLRRPQKSKGLHGPIDDAFLDSFLCVRGTGKTWHEATQKYVDQGLARFSAEWSKFMRGDLPVKNDVDIDTDDIMNKSLVLFGDPSSNTLIGQVLRGLPLQWTKESIVMGGKTYSAAQHVPVLIYPSPLNVTRYVVLNSGHTFHAADFLGTNALLYPRLGDYAILKPAPTSMDPLAAEVVTAGLFDEFWQLRKD